MSAPELLPCPFCGAKPHRNMSKVKHDQLHGEPYQDLIVKCPHLCASMEGGEGTVIELWNTRAILSDPRVKALVEALEVIASHRQKCHEHDADCSHELRTFDQEDVRLMELQARAALDAIKEATHD